ncbi:AarF/ABC1/UbiB kinase family protein [Pseudoalteromonas sp.]|nr:AarF/ABC1/UbiB kinase family protein [Pseudoalteromonas sp.]
MSQSKSVPTSRFARLSKFGLLASKVAGNVLLDGAKTIAKGEKLNRQSLIMSSKNIENLAEQLAQLRGAAMKLGQLLSMDSGELLPPELSQLLARLRSDGHAMPHKQLVSVFKSQWGEGWLDKLSHIELKPFAAASIGQVHKANLENGEALAIKVQYPGIAKSIESDVDNLASLLKLSGLLPKHIDIDPLIAEAKQQLLDEADYEREADFLKVYQRYLAPFAQFKVPQTYPELSTKQVLAMEFVDGIDLDECVELNQAQRDNLARDLIQLFFYELLQFNTVQTDPNFANYLYQPASETVVLLDFGATRPLPKVICDGYFKLFAGAIEYNEKEIALAAEQIGYFDSQIDQHYKQNVLNIFKLACEPLLIDEAYDFAASPLAKQIRDKGLEMSTQKQQWHSPPIDALFVHRKLAGLYLIAAKLNAKVNVYQLYQGFLTLHERDNTQP